MKKYKRIHLTRDASVSAHFTNITKGMNVYINASIYILTDV